MVWEGWREGGSAGQTNLTSCWLQQMFPPPPLPPSLSSGGTGRRQCLISEWGRWEGGSGSSDQESGMGKIRQSNSNVEEREL